MKRKILAAFVFLVLLSAVSCGTSDTNVTKPAAKSIQEEKQPNKNDELSDSVLSDSNEKQTTATSVKATTTDSVTTVAEINVTETTVTETAMMETEEKEAASAEILLDGTWVKVRSEFCGKTYEDKEMDSYETLEISGDKGKYTLNTVGTDKKWDITVEKASDGRYRLKLDGNVTFCEPVINGDEMSYTLDNGTTELICYFRKTSDTVPEFVPESAEEDSFDKSTENKINGTWKKKAVEFSDGSVYEEKDFRKGDIEVYIISGNTAKYTCGNQSWDFTLEKNEDDSYTLKMKDKLKFGGNTYFDGDMMYYVITGLNDSTKFIFEREKQ